jgi:RNase P/RNase MRP subunit p29
MASAPQQSLTSAWQRIIVDEAEQSVLVDGVKRPVRVLKSGAMFSFELQLDERVIGATGMLGKLESLAIVRLDDVAVSG